MDWQSLFNPWTYALLAGLLGIYFYDLYQTFTIFKRLKIPYVTPWPFVGNMGPTFFRRMHIHELTRRFYNKDPTSKYVGFFDIHNPIIMIRDPEIIKLVAVKNFENCPNHRAFVDEKQDPFFGKNLFAMKGEKWRELRNVLTPAFTASKMRLMFELINKCALDFSDFVIDDAMKSSAEVNVKDAFNRYTNDVIASCAFGLSVDSMRNPNNDFFLFGKKATKLQGFTFIKIFMIRSFPKLCGFFNIRVISESITNYFKSIVQETIDTRDKKGIVRPDMIQLMMDVRGKTSENLDMDIEEMTAQAFIFFFAGFETVSLLMCFMVVLLSRFKDVQKRLQDEVDQVMRESNGKPTYDKIVAMPYMDAVVNETLRLYPLVPALDRVCVTEFDLPPNRPGEEPIKVKPGMTLWLPAYAIQHDAAFYPDPEKFDPDRFLNVKVAMNQPDYMPFGIGPRACIANRFALMETKVVLFHFLSKCNFKTCEKVAWPLEFDKTNFNLSLKGGFWANLEKRKNSAMGNDPLITL